MFILGVIVGGIMFSGITYVIATTYYSNNVVYNNANSSLSATNVEDALDELYRKSVGPIITSIVDNEDLTATVNITVTVNTVKSVCVNSYAKTTDDCTWKSVSGTSFTTNAVSSAGSYYIHVQDTGGRITHSSSVSLTVSGPIYYSIDGTSSTNYTDVLGEYNLVFRADNASSARSAVCGLIGSTLVCAEPNTYNNNDLATQCQNAGVNTSTYGTNYCYSGVDTCDLIDCIVNNDNSAICKSVGNKQITIDSNGSYSVAKNNDWCMSIK